MAQSKYAEYEESGGSYDSDTEIKFTPYATISGVVTRAFGSESEYGQSFGVNFEDVQLIDGTLYADVDREVVKLFSWERAADMSPAQRFERGDTPTADDAPEFLRKTYVGNDKEYELIAARVPETEDWDASSKQRDVTFSEDGHEFGEWEDMGGEIIDVGYDVVAWFGGGEDPSVSATVVAETLSSDGVNAVNDDADIYNWLNDTSGDDVLREDMEGREIEFFIVQRQGDSGYTYNLPVILDKSTGAEIQPNNRDDGDSGNEDSGASRAVQEAEEEDTGPMPDPVAEFINSGSGLELTEDRANKLLDDTIENTGALTPTMVEEVGRENIIKQVT